MMKKIINIMDRCVYWPLLCLTAIISYGYLIVTYTYGVNDEVIEYYIYDTNMVAQDRIGIYLLNKIFHCYDLLPFWGEMIGVIFLCIAAVMWAYTVDSCMNHTLTKGILTIFACCLITFPYLGKSAIWRGCLAQAGQVLLLAALCAYFYYCFLARKKWKDVILSVIFGVMTLFFDKAYVTTIILGMGFVFLNYIRSKEMKWKQSLIEAVQLIVFILIMIFLDIGIVWGLQRILNVTPSHYTNTYFRYNEGNMIKQVLEFVPSLLKRFIASAKTAWSAKAICVSTIGTLLIGLFDSIKSKSLWNLLVSIGLVIDLSLMYTVTGNLWMPERSVSHIFSLFVALFFVNLLGICKNYWGKAAFVKYLVIGITIVFVANFSSEMERIYFAKYMTYTKDKIMLDEIMNDVYTEYGANTQKPIIFMGIPNDMTASWPAIENASVFSWGRLEDMEREENSRLLYGFINDNGYKVNGVPSTVDFREIRQQISCLNNWPQLGSTEEFDEYILVKLGDSKCEIIEEPREMLLNEYITNSSDILLTQNSLNIGSNNISLSGWVVQKGVNAYTNNVSLLLVSQNSEEHYKIRVEEVQNKDVTSYMNDGFNYDNSAYQQSVSLSKYITAGSYDLMLLLENEYGKYLVDLSEQVEVE